MKKRISVGILIPLVIAAALLTAAPASAAWGTTGSFQYAEGGCMGNRLFVTAPLMNAVPVSPGGNVIVIGSSHNQWVAYRAWVYHYESGQWNAGSWKAHQVGDDGYSSLFGDSWYDYDTRSWQGGTTNFTLNSRGTYAVYVQYYWFADQFVGAGGHGDFIGVSDYNSGALGMQTVCRY